MFRNGLSNVFVFQNKSIHVPDFFTPTLNERTKGNCRKQAETLSAPAVGGKQPHCLCRAMSEFRGNEMTISTVYAPQRGSLAATVHEKLANFAQLVAQRAAYASACKRSGLLSNGFPSRPSMPAAPGAPLVGIAPGTSANY